MDANVLATSRAGTADPKASSGLPTPDNQQPPEDTSKTKPPAPAHRNGMRYKEKFQALRERFDQVSATHDEYERDLELANARIRKLQAENDLLLDAISITVPATPSLMHLIRPSPTTTAAPPAPPTNVPPPSYTHPPPPPPLYHANGHGHGHEHSNGHGYGHAGGRYREREHDRVESNDVLPPEPIINGRAS